jgi:hypothetical protein
MNIPAARLTMVRPLTSRNGHARTGLSSDGRWRCNPATASDSTGRNTHPKGGACNAAQAYSWMGCLPGTWRPEDRRYDVVVSRGVFGSVAEVDTHVAQMKAALVAGAIVLEFSPQRLPGQREARRGNHARRVRQCDGARSRLHCTWCRTDTYGDRGRPRGSLVRAAIRLALHAPIAPRYLRTTVRSIWRHPLPE